MELRYYQKDAVASIYNYFAEGNSGDPIVAMPTGTGKSVVIADFVTSVIKSFPYQRLMMLTHVKELIEQNNAKLLSYWPEAPVGVFSAGLNRKETGFPVTFAGIASVACCPDLFGKIDLLLIDECHLVSPKDETMYRGFITALRLQNPRLKVIGFTATPYRLGLGMLTEGGLFTDVCFDLTDFASFNKLVEEGYLAPLITKRTTLEYDVSGVDIRGGEYVQAQLQEAVDKDGLTDQAISEIVTLGHDREHWLVFAAGIKHAHHVQEAFERRGVSCSIVHSKLTDDQRDKAIADFKEGRVRVLVNNNVLTTGFDFPGIDLIAVLRPMQSASLWVQMLGRGTRPSPGKTNCLVLDFAGNTRTLGPINDPVIPRPKGKKKGHAPVKVCESCGAYCHTSVRYCPCCGFEFHRSLNIYAEAGTEEVMKTVLTVASVVEVFKVDRVTYSPHYKVGGAATTLQVSYFSGLRMFREWVCLEHDPKSYPAKKAREWWRRRSLSEVPLTVNDAHALLHTLTVPSRVQVRLNSKYPEVVDYEF